MTNHMFILFNSINSYFFVIGIPLLEENEIENDGSNSSQPDDTVSATCSEASSK